MSLYFRTSDLPIRRRSSVLDSETRDERAAAAATTIALCREYVRRSNEMRARRRVAVEQPPDGVEPLAPPSSRVPLYCPR